MNLFLLRLPTSNSCQTFRSNATQQALVRREEYTVYQRWPEFYLVFVLEIPAI